MFLFDLISLKSTRNKQLLTRDRAFSFFETSLNSQVSYYGMNLGFEIELVRLIKMYVRTCPSVREKKKTAITFFGAKANTSD